VHYAHDAEIRNGMWSDEEVLVSFSSNYEVVGTGIKDIFRDRIILTRNYYQYITEMSKNVYVIIFDGEWRNIFGEKLSVPVSKTTANLKSIAIREIVLNMLRKWIM